MEPIVLPLMAGDSIADNVDYRTALPVNMTVVVKKVREAPGYLLSHPGLTSFATGFGADRAGYWNERLNSLFRVSGQTLITVSDNGTVESLGGISGTERASMAHSFNTQSIVANNKWWLYDGTDLVQQTDNDLGAPIDHTWIDGYYFFTDGESLYHTKALDETEIDPLDYQGSLFSPDPILAVDTTSDNQVIVFNRFSTEYFANRATDNFAFQRLQSKSIKVGPVGTHCETELEGTFYIMGGGREESISIHAISPGAYKSIASREIDQVIAKYPEEVLKTAVLETRVQDADRFIIVRLPNDTLLYNATVAKTFGDEYAWSIIKSSIETDGPWRGVNGAFKPNVGWVYGDLNTADIATLDSNVATQYGEQVETLLYTPFITLDSQVSVDELEVDIITGHQVDTDKVTTFLSLTENGVTWGKEWSILYGEQHEYGKRFIARRLGDAPNYVGYKLRTVSPERLAFSKFTLKVS